MRRIFTLALAGSAAIMAMQTAAHEAHGTSIDDAIYARRAYYTLLGANIGPLAAMAKGEAEYDAATAELHAGNLVRMGNYNPMPHFPAESDNEWKAGDTRALPAIWEDMAGFEQKFADFVEATKALAEVAGDGRGALGPAVGNLGGTCKACHDDYRAKDF